MISIFVARAKNGVIGNKDDLPWRLSSDLARFKDITLGHTVIMGRKTFDSIVSRLQKPLPGRENIVITRDRTFSYPNVKVVHSPEAALQLVKDKAFVIGGSQIYSQMLPFVDRLYITEIEAMIEGDAVFPELNGNEWREVSREAHKKDAMNEYDYNFVILDRVRQ